MIFDDCMNYRRKLRKCVEMCIMGTLTKEQALKLLNSRYKFMLPEEKLTLRLGEVPKEKARLFFALLKDEKKCNLYEYHLNNSSGTMQEFAEHAFNLKEALGLYQSGNDLDDNLFNEALEIGLQIIKYTKDITELYNFCKKELEEL